MAKKLPDLPFLLFLAVFFVLMPLVNFHATIDPSLVPRYFITSICLALYFFSRIFSPSINTEANSLPRAILAILFSQQIWMLITIAWSLNPGDALQEWFRMLSFGLFFVIAFHFLRQQNHSVIFLVRSAFFALLIFTYYGLRQLLPLVLDYLDKGTPIIIDLTIASSVSNKNFFSEVLTLLLPFYLYGVRVEKGRWLFISWAGVFICCFWILLLQTVSSWLAVSSGLLTVFVFAGISRSKKQAERQPIPLRKKIFLTVAAIAVLASVAFLYSKSNNFSYLRKKTEMAQLYLKKPDLFQTTSSANNNSIYERILIWKNSLLLIKEHPVTGAGLNNWKLLQAKFGIGGTNYLNTGMVHFEHPHNDFLLVWSEQGIPGIVLYVFFFFILLLQVLRLLKQSSDSDKRALLLMAAMAVTSFMVLSFFGYPRSRYYVMLVLMIWVAVVYLLSSEKGLKVAWQVSKNRLAVIVLFILSVFTSVVAWYWFSGEIHIRKAQAYQARKNYNGMIREAEKARTWLYPVEGTTTPVIWFEGMAYFYSGNVPAARVAFQAAKKVNPYHLRVLNDLATTYEQSGMREKAIEHYKLGLQITPLFIEGLLNLSAAYFNLHQPDSALEVISRIPEMKLSYRDEKNYKAFLPAILYAVAAKDTVNFTVSERKKQYLDYIANDTLLVNTFKLQRKAGNDFEGVLYQFFVRKNDVQ